MSHRQSTTQPATTSARLRKGAALCLVLVAGLLCHCGKKEAPVTTSPSALEQNSKMVAQVCELKKAIEGADSAKADGLAKALDVALSTKGMTDAVKFVMLYREKGNPAAMQAIDAYAAEKARTNNQRHAAESLKTSIASVEQSDARQLLLLATRFAVGCVNDEPISALLVMGAVKECLNAGDPLHFLAPNVTAKHLKEIETHSGIKLPEGTVGLAYFYNDPFVDPSFRAKLQIPADKVEAFLKSPGLQRPAQTTIVSHSSPDAEWWKPSSLAILSQGQWEVDSYVGHTFGKAPNDDHILYIEWMTH